MLESFPHVRKACATLTIWPRAIRGFILAGQRSMQVEHAFDQTPFMAIWEVTRACDLCCVHCRASANPRRDPRELSTAEAIDLIDQVRELSPMMLVLTGGDPLKRPDLFPLIERAVERQLNVSITPSVTPLLSADVIRRLASVGIRRIALSLDGPDAATHDAFRGQPGAYAATLDAIAAVRAAEVPLQINSSLSQQTVGHLTALSERVADIAPVLWSVFFVVPIGRAAQRQQLDPDTCERVFHYLYDWSERTGLSVKTTAAQAYRRVVLERQKTRARAGSPRQPRPLAVNDAKGFVFISHTGEVYPSGFLPVSAGNVRRTPLSVIYRTSPLFQALRDPRRLQGKCARCLYRHVCGGSRARAYAMTGNPFAEDPACVYQP